MAKHSYLKTLRKISRSWDRHRSRFKRSQHAPISIVCYRGYGSPNYIYISGRVLRDKGIIRRETDRFWHNLMNNVKRFISNEINGAKLILHFPNQQVDLITDNEGYFLLEANINHGLATLENENNWYPVDIQITEIAGVSVDIRQVGQVMITENTPFGIISDIDDTILKSDVTGLFKLKLLYLTLLKNAGSRIAFRQVSAFFKALSVGQNDQNQQPFFYVSNSPWNLYDLLEEFLRLNELPEGPIFLRDFGLPYQDLPLEYKGHKHDKILKILQTYPETAFVLIGDSGEKDTDIYLSIAAQFPKQIKAIYIRDVLHSSRAARVASLIKKVKNTPVKLFRNYDEAAEHAAEHGLIDYTFFEEEQKRRPFKI